MKPIFVTATGTNVGKTFVACALARHIVAAGHSLHALKPIETGLPDNGVPEDALALAEACGRPLAECSHGDFYRARLPLSPYGAFLGGEATLDYDKLVAALRTFTSGPTLVEGAGGLFVPLDPRHLIADLALALKAEVVLVAPDRLGVLSDVIAASLAAKAHGLNIAAVVLNRRTPADESQTHNLDILRERLTQPLVLAFEPTNAKRTLEVLVENLSFSTKRIRE